MPPLALVGNLSRDVVDGGPPRIGGAPYYAARAWRALGSRATIVTRCGPDDRVAFARRLSSLGLPVVMLPGTKSTSFSFYYDADVRVMTVEQAGDQWTPADAGAVAPGAWVHVAPLLRSDFPRVAEPGPLRLDANFDRAMLEHVQVLKLAEEEAEVIGAVEELRVPEVLVTYGARGSCVYVGGRAVEVGAWPVAADPTGSGDAFSATYLAGRSQGLSPVSAARRATALVGALLTGRTS